jgi:hypothetical protein
LPGFQLISVGAGAVLGAAYLIDRARKQGLHPEEVGPAEAAELIFPPGHPRPGVVYVGHPLVPHQYFTLADFHRRTFEHKVGELIDLLAHLGAQHFRVEHVRGKSTELMANASAAVLDEGQAAAGISASTRSISGLRSEWRLSRPAEGPRLPDNLVWYQHEDLWQRVASRRIRHGLQSFALELTYEDDFGVSADIGAAFKKCGLNLGGTFSRHEETTWRLVGDFHPI